MPYGRGIIGRWKPNGYHLLFYSRCSHDSSPEELADSPKLIRAPLQSILEHIMSIRGVLLRFPESTNAIILCSTFRTLCFLAI